MMVDLKKNYKPTHKWILFDAQYVDKVKKCLHICEKVSTGSGMVDRVYFSCQYNWQPCARQVGKKIFCVDADALKNILVPSSVHFTSYEHSSLLRTAMKCVKQLSYLLKQKVYTHTHTPSRER